MATRREIVDRSGRQLKASSVGIDLGAEDFELIANVYDGLHERLLHKNKIYWADSDCVPLEAEGLIVSMVSGTTITEDSDFGLSDPEIQKITLMEDRARLSLQELKNDIPTGEQAKACYF